MKRFTVLLAVLALIAVPLIGATVGTIKVTVTDASGAALPGATVEATSPTSIGSRTEVTDGMGVAHLSGLAPGKYTVKVSLEGMQSQTHTITVSSDKVSDVSA